jgi:benzoyl-CoA reductase/2-hydroxyglutaryl-CoA dehydratase subunit BcrC/BadD/HgdB
MNLNFKEWIERGEDEPIEFDKRYSSPSQSRTHQRKTYHNRQQIFNNWIDSNKKIVEKLKQAPNRAKSMDYFDNFFCTSSRINELQRQKAKGKKIVGTYCNVIPFELIYAAGAIPIRLCSGDYHSISAGEEIFPKDSCPLIKSSIGWGLIDHPLLKLCDALIIPATCDGKKKMAEIMNDYNPVWMVNPPPDKERRRSVKYWQAELHIMKKKLEHLTNKKVSKEMLKEAIITYQEVQKTNNEILLQRKNNVITGSDYLIVMESMFFADPKSWIKQAKVLIDELKTNFKSNKLAKNKNIQKILLTGAPSIMPNLKIPLCIESFDALILTDITCSGSQYFYDPVVIDEWNMSDMINAISERYLMPSVCPCFVKSDDRIDKLLDMIKEYNIDGVIYHTLRLCLLFDVESCRLKDVLESKGIPHLIINTDYSQEDMGQVTTRIEAFIEILKARKE